MSNTLKWTLPRLGALLALRRGCNVSSPYLRHAIPNDMYIDPPGVTKIIEPNILGEYIEGTPFNNKYVLGFIFQAHKYPLN